MWGKSIFLYKHFDNQPVINLGGNSSTIIVVFAGFCRNFLAVLLNSFLSLLHEFCNDHVTCLKYCALQTLLGMNLAEYRYVILSETTRDSLKFDNKIISCILFANSVHFNLKFGDRWSWIRHNKLNKGSTKTLGSKVSDKIWKCSRGGGIIYISNSFFWPVKVFSFLIPIFTEYSIVTLGFDLYSLLQTGKRKRTASILCWT